MGNYDEIKRETMQFCLALTLADLKYSEFAMLDVAEQFRIAAGVNLTPEALTVAVVQLGAIQRVRSAEMMRQMQPVAGSKPS